MNISTRRDLLKYALGGTLASALPAACCGNDQSCMPLIVDLTGPMAFTMGQKVIDVWLPDLESIDSHEAGIATSKLTFALPKGHYTITGMNAADTAPEPHRTRGCTVYRAATDPDPNLPSNSYIRLTLPMPHRMVALDPVGARIYPNGSKDGESCKYLAVGVRFLYDHAGVPTLTPPGGDAGIIPFELAPGEIQLNMSIDYTPFDRNDPKDMKAKCVFTALATLFLNQDLQVEFGEPPLDGKSKPLAHIFTTPMRNCRAPIIFPR
jgi:hypothetical protein